MQVNFSSLVSDDSNWSWSPICYLGEDGIVRGVELATYPNGEPRIQKLAATPVRLLLRPRSMAEFMAGLFLADAIAVRGNGMPIAELILPLPPGTRQDRLNDEGDYLFTAKSIAKEINLRNFDSVVVIDPHSDVTPALIDRCHVVHPCDFIHPSFATRYHAVISPDGGAEKRAGAVARKLGLRLLHGWKKRNVSDGLLAGFGLEDSHGVTKALVVDDICDGGGTFIGLADVLKERGIQADLFVTHGIFSQGAARLTQRFGTVYTTDSVIGHNLNVEVLPVCQSLLGGKRIQ